MLPHTASGSGDGANAWTPRAKNGILSEAKRRIGLRYVAPRRCIILQAAQRMQ